MLIKSSVMQPPGFPENDEHVLRRAPPAVMTSSGTQTSSGLSHGMKADAPGVFAAS
jgi:hypothetical protein